MARYAIGRLLEEQKEVPTVNEKAECVKNCLEKQSCEAKIAGLEPMNFITVATPHLGSRGHKQVALSFVLTVLY